MRIALGLGCDRGVPLQTLKTAVEQALAKVSLSNANVVVCASIDKKNDEQAMLQLAALNGWPMQYYSAAQLAEVEVPNPSEVVRKFMGTPAVAEAAALLAAHGGIGDLLLEKHKYCGADGKNATVSIAKFKN